MPIELHCEHCGKLVRAPDEAAGKHGKCPSCHQTVYIPTPPDEIEPLPLQPIDEDAEREAERARREAAALQKALLEDRAASPELPGGDKPNLAGQILEPRLDMETLVIEYAAAMARGDLAQAEEYAEQIKRDLRAAEDVMQRITVDELPPPQLADIPRPVLVGFFKQLRH